MSNATQHSHQSGDSRRRRSRGGRNRNSNQNNRRGGDRDNREERDNRDNRGSRDSNRGSQSGRSEEFRPQAPRRTYAPPKLTWWQKLLQIVGLYKAPTPPSRTERKPEAAKPQGDPRPAKSNTRNARTSEGQSAEKSGERTRERSDERPPKRERSPRNADRDRPRGGDGSTVESPRVYVGNLSYDVSEQDLQELFKGIGPVRNVEIVYNRSTHRSKGYGFVEMLHKDEAVRSVEVLHDQPFMGRKLIVSGAKSKGQDEREDQEETPREPRKIVVAPIPQAPAAVEETSTAIAEAPAEVAAVAETEPVIQTIVENVTETPVVEETPAVAEAAADLVAKYGFDEPKEETKEA